LISSLFLSILLTGPSGSGKTHIVNFLLKRYSQISSIYVNGSEIFDKFVGSSEKKIREIFKRAREVSPCIVFIDELDIIAGLRGRDSTGVLDRVVNQLLTELDGSNGKDDNIYFVAATNRKEALDPAILRPGRIDKIIRMESCVSNSNLQCGF